MYIFALPVRHLAKVGVNGRFTMVTGAPELTGFQNYRLRCWSYAIGERDGMLEPPQANLISVLNSHLNSLN